MKKQKVDGAKDFSAGEQILSKPAPPAAQQPTLKSTLQSLSSTGAVPSKPVVGAQPSNSNSSIVISGNESNKSVSIVNTPNPPTNATSAESSKASESSVAVTATVIKPVESDGDDDGNESSSSSASSSSSSDDDEEAPAKGYASALQVRARSWCHTSFGFDPLFYLL
jgi:hypothetical protein